jgi:subtilisin family serine protease
MRKKLLFFMIFLMLFISSSSRISINARQSDSSISTKVTNNINNNDFDNLEEIYILIKFDYNGRNSVFVANEKNQSLSKTDYREKLSRFFEKRNTKYLEKLGLDDYKTSVSSFSVFSTVQGFNTIDDLYDAVSILEESNLVEAIWINHDEIHVSGPPSGPCILDANGNCIFDPEPPPAERYLQYDNYPNDTQYTGDNIKIGVLDTGVFDTSNPNFAETTAMVVHDTYSSPDETDHPERVASVLGGIYGVAPDADIYYSDVNSPDKPGYTEIEKLLHVGVDIINMSIGNGNCAFGTVVEDGAQEYLDNIVNTTGVILVAATGNWGQSRYSNSTVCSPANSTNVISVGAIGTNGVPAVFTNFTNATGSDSNPVISAVGVDREIEGWSELQDGTSFSSPAVAGTVALLLEKHGNLNTYNIITILTATANNNVIDTGDQTIPLIALYQINGQVVWALTGEEKIHSNAYDSSMGVNPMTGAGALDIEAALNYDGPIITTTFTGYSANTSTQIDTIYLESGDEFIISLAWNRETSIVNDIIFLEDLVNMQLQIYDSNNLLVAETTKIDSLMKIIRYYVQSTGTYTIKLYSTDDSFGVDNWSYSYITN